jgi:hypothetical protein
MLYFWRIGNFLANSKACSGCCGESDRRGGSGKQPADGRTILTMDVPVVAAPALAPDRHLRLETDFAPVIKLSKDYSVLVVSPSVPARTLAELIALLKAQPSKFNFSSGPFGTPAHLIGEMFKLQTGVIATHVPYPGPQQRLEESPPRAPWPIAAAAAATSPMRCSTSPGTEAALGMAAMVAGRTGTSSAKGRATAAPFGIGLSPTARNPG